MQNDTISRTEAMRQFTAEPKMKFTLGEIVAKLDALPAVDAVEVSGATKQAVELILGERCRQVKQWGEHVSNHPYSR